MPSNVLLPALLLAAATPASDMVHKCRRADGSIAYQSLPCARGERSLAAWAVERDPIVEPRARMREPRRERAPRREGARPPRPGRVLASRDPCREARERRDAIERRVGLARTYELLSALQREVYEACK